jgi:hypothetical protein
MATAMAMRRDDLYHLVDGLPDADVPTVRRMLQALQPSVRLPQLLADAPADDEGTSADEEAAVKEALEAQSRGDVHSAEDARRLLLG